MKLDGGISAVVTGGASGLGAAAARALAQAGVKVAIFDSNAESGMTVAFDIGGQFCAVDVTDDASVAAGFAAARKAHGQERILVNCAGIVGSARTVSRNRETGVLAHFPLDVFAKIVAVNLSGSFRCIALSAQGMAALDPCDGERGVIVNTGSIAATDGQVGQAAYSASKAGIVGLTLPVARDLAAEGIRVNTILPGLMETPMMATIPQAVRDSLAASVPFPKRLGRAEEFASLVLEIVRNGYMNGETIRLDGAIRLPPK
jgi:NAD(P)-dependent dehydrogenase (short-subunit alcohol dehydrogenase family)